MQAKSGKAITAIAPTKPEEAYEADEANPGKVAEVKAKQIERKKGKYGSTVIPAYKPPNEQTDEQKGENTSWIEIELLEEDNTPVAGVKYEIALPDGTFAKGTLDGNGLASVNGIKPGECKVCFPELDTDAWSKA